jgi:hypothetical protein
VVACGTRTVIDAVFGPIAVGETTQTPRLLRCLRPGMLLLADRNFAVADLLARITATGAQALIRCKNSRPLPDLGPLPDGSRRSVMGGVAIRVVDADITVTLGGGKRHTGRYRLVTTLLDHHRHPARDLVTLYHRRWEIETAYLELKSTVLGGRVLRSRTPEGIDQEVHALLVTYQAIRLAMADAIAAHTDTPPDRAGFTVALHAARDQVVHATGVITGTTIDLVGRIGHAVLAHLLPARRSRSCPRVVKRAISKHRAKGTIDRTNHHATIDITILTTPALTTTTPP